MISQTFLQGAWRLTDFALEDPSGDRKPWGSQVRGLLIYDPSGRMSVSINKAIEKSSSEAQDTLDAMLFYSGRYRVEEDRIIHDVEIASDPERVGKELVRFASIHVDVLELVSPKHDWGRAILQWRKI